MEISLIVAFWGVSILFVLTPGVDWAYAIGTGVGGGRVGAAVSGMLIGHMAATLVVAAGVAAVIAASNTAMVVLTAAGAAYLVWLGLSSIGGARTARVTSTLTSSTGGRLFAKGVGVSLLNPKVLLLFLALLPQFTSPSGWPLAMQIIGLGILHVLNCAIVYLGVGWAAGSVLSSRPRAAQAVTLISGIVMVALGVGLLSEVVIDALG